MYWRIYNFLIWILIGIIRLNALSSIKAKKAIKGREKKLLFPSKKSTRVWIHSASVGEFEQARPILERLKSEFGHEILLSFFSPSGYEQFKNYGFADQVFYMPFDRKKNAENYIQNADLDLVIFVKYEFWWNHLRNLTKNDIPVLFISASFRKDHYLLKSWAAPMLNVLQKIDRIFLIDAQSHKILEAKGFKNLEISGDTRIDSILNLKKEHLLVPEILDFKGKSKLLIFGSTYKKEHNEIIKIHNNLDSELKIMIFPHEIDRQEISRLKLELGEKAVLFSEYHNLTAGFPIQILIVDSIGMLAKAYRYADISYIGGAFNHGLHNILEAFVYKIPLIYGSNHEKFAEARFLATKPFVKVIEKVSELENAIYALTNVNFETDIQTSYEELFQNITKPTELIIKYIDQKLKEG